MATAEAPGTFDIFNSNQIEPAPSAAREPAINSPTKKNSDEDICAFAIGANPASGCPQQTSSVGRHTDKEHGLSHSAGGTGTSTSSILEVAIWREWNAGTIRAVFDKGSHGFTNQRREDAGVGVEANGVALAQQQASAVDADTPGGAGRPPSARSEITQIWPAGWTPRTMF